MTTTLNRRQFMKLMAAAAAAGSVPAMYSARAFSQQSAPDGIL
jgi:TAT (twin-arginine translocation) pathway signal sequence.